MKKKALPIALSVVLLAASALVSAQGLPRADPRDARRGGGPDLDQYPAHNDSRADRDRRERRFDNRSDRRRWDASDARKRDRKHEHRNRDRKKDILPEILGR